MDFCKTIDDVRDLVSADDLHKWDCLVSRRDLCLKDGNLYYPQAAIDCYSNGLTLSHWAQGQICQKLGIPANYFRKCPTSLQDTQFNYWVHESNDQDSVMFVRGKGSAVRGIMTGRYAKLDNKDVMDALYPIVVGSTYKVSLCMMGDEAFHLRLVNPVLFRDVLPNDRLLVGIHISNSEVGARAVTVEALVYRLVCSNGLIMRIDSKSLMKQRHVSLSPERFKERFAEAIAQAAAVATGFLDQIHSAARTRIIEPEQAVSRISKAWELPKATEQLVRQALVGEQAQGTLYSVVNAITSAAQRLSMDDRYALEIRAANLIAGTKAEHALRGQIVRTGVAV